MSATRYVTIITLWVLVFKAIYQVVKSYKRGWRCDPTSLFISMRLLSADRYARMIDHQLNTLPFRPKFCRGWLPALGQFFSLAEFYSARDYHRRLHAAYILTPTQLSRATLMKTKMLSVVDRPPNTAKSENWISGSRDTCKPSIWLRPDSAFCAKNWPKMPTVMHITMRAAISMRAAIRLRITVLI